MSYTPAAKPQKQPTANTKVTAATPPAVTSAHAKLDKNNMDEKNSYGRNTSFLTDLSTIRRVVGQNSSGSNSHQSESFLHLTQPKLKIIHPSDAYEKEADSVADQLVGVPPSADYTLNYQPSLGNDGRKEEGKNNRSKGTSSIVHSGNAADTTYSKISSPAERHGSSSTLHSSDSDSASVEAASVGLAPDSLFYVQRSIGNNNNDDNNNHRSTNMGLTPPTNPPDNNRLNSTIGISLQPKLKVSQPGDIYEQEADRVAEKVMRQESSYTPSVQSSVSENEERSQISKESQTVSYPETKVGIPERNIIHFSVGSLLNSSTRELMESTLQYDFGNVRIHTNDHAAKSAEALNARAYAVGTDVVFGEGEYQPNTLDGKRLLAHELIHVVQQSSTITPTFRERLYRDNETRVNINSTSKVSEIRQHSTQSIARSPISLTEAIDPSMNDDLNVSTDLSKMSDEDIRLKLREIYKWLAGQISTNPTVLALQDKQLELEAELTRRHIEQKKKEKEQRKKSKGKDKHSLQNLSSPRDNLPTPRSAVSSFDIDKLSPEEQAAELQLMEEWLPLQPKKSWAAKQVRETQSQLSEHLAKQESAPLLESHELHFIKVIGNHLEDREFKMLNRYQAISQTEKQIKIGWLESELAMQCIELIYAQKRDMPIRSAISETIGGASNPENLVNKWSHANDLLRTAKAALDKNDFSQAQDLINQSVSNSFDVFVGVKTYFGEVVKGAERTVTGLKVAKAAGAVAAGIATGGATTGLSAATTVGIVGSGLYAGAQSLAEQGSEVAFGLRDKIDWGRVTFDTIVGGLTGFVGGKIGGAVVGRLLSNPAVASLGQKVVANLVGDYLAGRAGSSVYLIADTTYRWARGEEGVTWGQLVDNFVDQMTDPKAAFMDIVIGGASRRLHATQGRETVKALPEEVIPEVTQVETSNLPGQSSTNVRHLAPTDKAVAAGVEAHKPVIEPTPSAKSSTLIESVSATGAKTTAAVEGENIVVNDGQLQSKTELSKTNKLSGQPQAASSILLGQGDKLASFAGKVKPLGGSYDVVVHGSSDSFHVLHNGKWVEIDHRRLANYMKSAGYTGGDVRLISCGTGSNPTAIAQHLSNKLGVSVMAPSDTVWIWSDGNLTIGPDPGKNVGVWNNFSPKPSSTGTPHQTSSKSSEGIIPHSERKGEGTAEAPVAKAAVQEAPTPSPPRPKLLTEGTPPPPQARTGEPVVTRLSSGEREPEPKPTEESKLTKGEMGKEEVSKAAKSRNLPNDPQRGVREGLENIRQKIEADQSEINIHRKQILELERRVYDLRIKTRETPRSDPTRASTLKEFKEANEKLGELKARQEHREQEIGLKRAHEKRLVEALNKKTYERPGFWVGMREKVWEQALKDGKGRVYSPSGTEIKPGDPWIMGHREKFEFWKHQRSAAERGISREQFIQEYNDHRHYRPETKDDSEGHYFEDKTDAYDGY